MKRRLFTTILSALSLLLCVAVVIAWGLSHVRADRFSWGYEREAPGDWEQGSVSLLSCGGGVRLQQERTASVARESGMSALRIPRGFGWFTYAADGYPNADEVTLGFHWAGKHRSQTYSYGGAQGRLEQSRRTVVIPYWFLVALVATPVVVPWLFESFKRSRRQGAGLCPSCGYDLRATARRCPECGRVAADGPSAPPSL